MTLRIRRASERHLETLRALHTLTFPLDEHEDYSSGYWWIVWDGAEPVGFAGSRHAYTEPETTYLSRCGVLASHRGLGLQRRLLKARLKAAEADGHVAVITTTYCNPPSGNNLIRAGFRMYTPVEPWSSSEGTCYWRKDLT